MTVLFTDSAGTLNQQTSGSSVTFSYGASGRTETVSLLTSSGSAWTSTSGFSVYNVVREESPVRPEFASGSRDPMIFVIEKSNDASNNNLFVWAFDESGSSAKANTSVPLTTTAVGLTNLESKYLVDLNKNKVISDYGKYPKFVQLEETSAGFVFDLGYAESKTITGLSESLVPLKTAAGGIWSAISSYTVAGAIVSNDYYYSYNNSLNQYVLSGSSNLTIGVLSDVDGLGSGSPTILNNFVLNDSGTQFVLSTASLTSLVDSRASATISSTAGTSGLTSFEFLEFKLNTDLDGTGFLGVGTPIGVGSGWSSIGTFQVTASDVIYNNGRFFSKEEHIIGTNDVVVGQFHQADLISGYTFYETSDLNSILIWMVVVFWE